MNYYVKVLKNYTGFEGRASRSEYWYFVLFNTIISLIMGGIHEWLGSIYGLAVLVPTIAVLIRRMHDVGKNGWYCLIPLYNLVLACTGGTKGANQYGGPQ